ncbi:hypothetical protein [Noviherbaspirillum massiliense]|uniref:hypothetical protein n=1 Tax=Noviherbaspirillum massiliense TaxID=1465823 RepID=UPI00036DF938|nr:hypothetical protein [Noviherbaspirillum massiliense]
MRLISSLVSLSVFGMLVACGGGFGDDDSSNNDVSSLFSVTASGIPVQEHSTTTPFATSSTTEFLAFGATCSRQPGTYNVKETANAIVYNADSVPSSVLSSIAQYADASIQTLRARYSFPGPAGFDGTKVRVCASVNNGTNGSAGINTLYVGTKNTGRMLAQLVHHEMTHLVQAQALQCRTDQYRFERWLAEGMALHMGQQDMPRFSQLSNLRAQFATVNTGTPFGDTDNTTYPVTARYPGYRLAFDTFLGEYKRTDIDVVDFLKSYGAAHHCPSDPNGNWKVEFDARFGTDLRGAGVLGTTFWFAAKTYAQ